MSDVEEMLKKIEKYINDPTKGLPEEVFLFITKITPMVNVDLLVKDVDGRILLAWRNDLYHGNGWHVPGGILRVKETFEERIQKTAENEIGCHVIASKKPIEVVPIISNDLTIRCHFITFIYECKLPEDFQINNGKLKSNETGYLEWHKKYPGKMLSVHRFYKKYFE